MKTFGEIEELIRHIDAVNSAEPTADNRLVMWNSLLEIQSMPEGDPFSETYSQRCLDIYEYIADRKYAPHTGERVYTTTKLIPTPYSFTNSKTVGEFYNAYGGILQTLNVVKGDSILEYGPGSGRISLALARMGCDVSVVDVEKIYIDMIEEEALQLGININTKVGLFGEGFSDKKFDRILFFEAFHHAFYHEDLLRKIRQMLKPDGFIVFSGEPIVAPGETPFVPYPWGPRLDGQSVFCMRKFGWMELGFHHGYFTELLMRTGFNVRRWANPSTGMGNCYIAEPNQGRVKVGSYEIGLARADAGWYPAEGSHRWTNGDARFPVDLSYPWQQATITGQNCLPVTKNVRIVCGDSESIAKIAPNSDFSISVNLKFGGEMIQILSEAHCPRDFGTDDGRKLGVCIFDIRYS